MVPVPNLETEGGRRQSSLLWHNTVKQQQTVYQYSVPCICQQMCTRLTFDPYRHQLQTDHDCKQLICCSASKIHRATPMAIPCISFSHCNQRTHQSALKQLPSKCATDEDAFSLTELYQTANDTLFLLPLPHLPPPDIFEIINVYDYDQ